MNISIGRNWPRSTLPEKTIDLITYGGGDYWWTLQDILRQNDLYLKYEKVVGEPTSRRSAITNHTLYRYPSTPLPRDSSANYLQTLPVAQYYYIIAESNKCVDTSDDAEGAPVAIRVRIYVKYHSTYSVIHNACRIVAILCLFHHENIGILKDQYWGLQGQTNVWTSQTEALQMA